MIKKLIIAGVATAAVAMPAAAQQVDPGTIINAAAQIYNATRGYNNWNNGYYNNGYYNNGYYNNGWNNNWNNNGYYYNNPNYNNGYNRYYQTWDNNPNVRRGGYYIDNWGNRVYYRP